MKLSSLVGHTVELLDLFRGGHTPADDLLSDFYRKRRYLGARDRRWIGRVYYGVLRNFKKLRALITRNLTGPGQRDDNPIASIMFVIAHEILMGETPWEEVAEQCQGLWMVVGPNVECSRFCGELARGDRSIGGSPLERISTEFSMPTFVVHQWLLRFGEEETANLCSALNSAARISMRVNTLRTSVEACAEALHAEGIEVHRSDLAPEGLITDHRMGVQGLKSYQAGLFEMQDEGSQVISLLVDPQPGETVLDACAGAGGKSLHLAAMMKNTGTLLVRDSSERRLGLAAERAARAGVTILKTVDSAESAEGTMDRILVDAPCSGVGTFRRNPGLKMVVTEAYVRSRADIQRGILSHCAPLVKRGGRLVYATCSLLREENEDVVAWFLEQYRDYALVPPPQVSSGVVEGGTLTLLPHRTGTDGFFAAILVRS